VFFSEKHFFFRGTNDSFLSRKKNAFLKKTLFGHISVWALGPSFGVRYCLLATQMLPTRNPDVAYSQLATQMLPTRNSQPRCCLLATRNPDVAYSQPRCSHIWFSL